MSVESWVRKIHGAALYCADAIWAVIRRGTLHLDRVLLIRLDAIGDFVLWMDAAQATVEYYKGQGKSVVLLANAVWAAWAKDLRIFDDVIALDRRRFERNVFYRYRIEYRIRMLGCGIAVEPTYSREWLFGDAIVRISGAIERIGSFGNHSNITSWQKRVSDRWYTRLIWSDPSHRMELIRNAEFVRKLCENNYLAKIADLRATTALLLDEAFAAAIGTGERYYVLFPGASWEGKQWPVANFAQIAEMLYARTNWHGVVCGGRLDRKVAEALCDRCSAPLLDWAGRTDLPQLAAILAGAQLLVTNDTSAPHIATACGVATVCLLGGGHSGRFMPYEVERADERPLPRAVAHEMPCFGCNWRCIYERPKGSPMPCMEGIDVEKVWRAINEVLGHSD